MKTTKAQLNAFIAEFNASHTVDIVVLEDVKTSVKKVNATNIYRIGWNDISGHYNSYTTVTKSTFTNTDLLNIVKRLATELSNFTKVETTPELTVKAEPDFDPFALFN